MASRSSSPWALSASTLASQAATLVSALALAPLCAAREAERLRSSPRSSSSSASSVALADFLAANG